MVTTPDPTPKQDSLARDPFSALERLLAAPRARKLAT